MADPEHQPPSQRSRAVFEIAAERLSPLRSPPFRSCSGVQKSKISGSCSSSSSEFVSSWRLQRAPLRSRRRQEELPDLLKPFCVRSMPAYDRSSEPCKDTFRGLRVRSGVVGCGSHTGSFIDDSQNRLLHACHLVERVLSVYSDSLLRNEIRHHGCVHS